MVAVDFEYLKAQSCSELANKFEALAMAKKTINETIQKKIPTPLPKRLSVFF